MPPISCKRINLDKGKAPSLLLEVKTGNFYFGFKVTDGPCAFTRRSKLFSYFSESVIVSSTVMLFLLLVNFVDMDCQIADMDPGLHVSYTGLLKIVM